MNYEFVYEENFLIIKLSGPTGVNERLLAKEHLTSHLHQPNQKVIVDLEELKEAEGTYLFGVLNTVKKEVQLMGGKVKFCSLKPEIYHYFQDNRLDQIFDIGPSIEQTKLSFKEKSDGG